MWQTKVVQKLATKDLGSKLIFFFLENHAINEIMRKNTVEWGMAHAHCMLDT